ncbi:glycoside hydrolase family 43 protein [Polaribacter sp. L3A8]|uniref:glycoside hydrolase family 43 protein n=1 Tax=Polaribacter sp. L3A8 TaxID=2686361 RepID=UPI00131D8E1A|nr:glycoside hydrolase family 43 protein [Polaribacter sp. L3A8]
MIKNIKSIIYISILIVSFHNYFAQEKHSSFKPGEIWKDTDGVHINAHGAGVLTKNDTYYLFGEHKVKGSRGNQSWVGVRVYSSKDLYNWKNEGVALKVTKDPSSKLVEGSLIERPKVIYNDKTKKYVMWFHHELKGRGYDAALVGVAVSDNVTGPYNYIDSFRMHPNVWPKNFSEEQKQHAKKMSKQKLKWGEGSVHGVYFLRDFESGQMSRDMTLFKDDDGVAYHITASEENGTLIISKLSSDFLSLSDEYIRVFPGGNNEAPAIFKKDGKYFMISSGLTGWDPNSARSAMADNMLGSWTSLGNPARGNEKERKTTFHSQSTHILPVMGKKDAYIFMADRWMPQNAINGRYVWLPIEFEDEKPIIKWYSEWSLDFFDK